MGPLTNEIRFWCNSQEIIKYQTKATFKNKRHHRDLKTKLTYTFLKRTFPTYIGGMTVNFFDTSHICEKSNKDVIHKMQFCKL